MSYVIAAPELLAGAATDLAGLGSTLQIANRAAAATITGVPAAGADDVSAALAAVFSGHALDYQALSAQMAGVHQRFVQALTASGSSYAAAEAANTNPLQGVEEHLLGVLNSPTQALLGRPLIGDGAGGTGYSPTTGSGAVGGNGGAGGTGGWLYGSGGSGGIGGVGGSGTIGAPSGHGGSGGLGGGTGLFGQGGAGGNGGQGGGENFASTAGAGGPAGTGGHGGWLYGNGGAGGIGGAGLTPGADGIGGTSGLVLGLDGFNAPANTSPLHTLQQQALNAINAPVEAATGRPLIGNGTPGAAGSGADGTAGGWLLGDGGA
ncbi:PE family protein, partial [Mycobacterium marinum]|uniref:PE family protein n=1 Tax=Mycobacterium marinum TaxID=1781 RepID=UPI0035645D5A